MTFHKTNGQIIFVKCLIKLARFTQEMKPMTKA